MDNANGYEQQAAPKKKSKLGLILGITIPVVIIALVGGIFAAIAIGKNNQYKQALSLLDEGDFSEAIAIHEELGDYKDLGTQIVDYAVDEAEDLLDDGEYEKLNKLVKKVKGYEEAMTGITELVGEKVADLLEENDFETVTAISTELEKQDTIIAEICTQLVAKAEALLQDNQYDTVMMIRNQVSGNEEAMGQLNTKLVEKMNGLLGEGAYDSVRSLYNTMMNNGLQIDELSAAVYGKAEELFGAADYDTAEGLYDLLGDYENSQSRIEEIQDQEYFAEFREYLNNGNYAKALRMIENYSGSGKETMINEYKAHCADGTYLADLQKALEDRSALGAVEDYQLVIDAELAYLQKYQDMPFYDSRLEELADQYYSALMLQQDAISIEDRYEFYFAWHYAAADRYDVVTLLHREYQFLNDNDELLSNFLDNGDEIRRIMGAYEIIHEDLKAQLWGVYAYVYENTTYYVSYTNNTQYTFSAELTHEVYADDAYIYTDNFTIPLLAPGESINVLITLPDNGSYIWYTDWDLTSIFDGATQLF